MSAATTLDRPYEPLLEWLAGHDIEYEIHQHDPSFTARATAAAEGVDPRTFAKVVAVASPDGRAALVVLDATDQVDLHKARQVLGAGDVRLLTEPELTALAPGCEAGAIPAVWLAVRADHVRRLCRSGRSRGQLQRRQSSLQRTRGQSRLGACLRRRLRRSRRGRRQRSRVGTLMTSASGDGSTMDDPPRRPSTLVWIDSREAIIVRWLDGRARLERLESEVPAHRRATGHVRHDPAVRHGGGGTSQTAGEPHRLEHLNQFVGQVADRLQPGDDVLILGSGTVHERLAGQLARSDAHHRRHRRIACEASPRFTDRQLIARLRAFAGAATRRRTVGAYRWAGLPAHRPSDRPGPAPRRVVDKPPRRKDQDGP